MKAPENIHVIEDVIPKEMQDELEKKLLGNQFPLFLNTKSVYVDEHTGFWDSNTKESVRLNHCFVTEGQLVSNEWPLIESLSLAIVNKIGIPPKMSSCKLNVNFPVVDFSEKNYYPPHFDTTDKGIVAIYYVNDADGDTLFMQNEKVDGQYPIIYSFTPRKGTLIYFPESQLHANKPPRATPARCVINFNFLQDF